MHFFTSISLASTLIALSNAIPTLTSRSSNFCPNMSHITPAVKCSSGFIGCVAYDKGSEICNGPKRFYNDCSGAPGLGSFYNCANGFVGCTTNSRICDTGSTGSVWKRNGTTDCPFDSSYYVCASNGFRGCSTNPHICDSDRKPVNPVVEPVEDPSTTCPTGSSYYVCASNGFRGCSTNPHICDTATIPTCTKSAPTPSASVIYEVTATPTCTDPVPKPTRSVSRDTPTTPTAPIPTPFEPCSTPPTPSCPVVTPSPKPCQVSSGSVGCTGGTEEQPCGTCSIKHEKHNCADDCDDCKEKVKTCE